MRRGNRGGRWVCVSRARWSCRWRAGSIWRSRSGACWRCSGACVYLVYLQTTIASQPRTLPVPPPYFGGRVLAALIRPGRGPRAGRRPTRSTGQRPLCGERRNPDGATQGGCGHRPLPGRHAQRPCFLPRWREPDRWAGRGALRAGRRRPGEGRRSRRAARVGRRDYRVAEGSDRADQALVRGKGGGEGCLR